jgi:hypothetical protein
MDLIKKNLISIICGVIAILAIGAQFYPLGNWISENQTKLEQHKRVHDQMSALVNKDRQLPVVNPDNPTQEKLTAFPGPKVIEQGKAITEAVKTESLAMRDAAVEMNKHALLVEGSLPAPTTFLQYNFRDRYKAGFAPATTQPGSPPNLALEMKAGIPPAQDEVSKKQAELAQTITKEKLLTVGTQAINQAQVQQEVQERVSKLPDQIRTERAQQSMVYVNPDAFQMDQQIQGSGAPDPVNIFLAQISLWVQQDVVSAINQVNKAAKSVIDAPVKRLIKVVVQPWFITVPDVPTSGDPDGVVPKSIAVSATGRASSALFDVMHFTIQADVEAARLPAFLRELGRRRLITPLQMDVKAVDSAQMMGQGFVYGKEPVVNVTIQCEELFLRQWLTAYMPALIKQKLGIQEQAAAPAAGT